jgi:hypothetical protein
MTMEEYKDCYFDYLVTVILEAIKNADEYTCKDFLVLKLELVNNLGLLMKSREHYNEAMQTLREKEVKDENIKRLKI